MFTGLIGGIHGCLLRCKGRTFARAAEAERSGALPGERAAFAICNRNDRVVERGLDMSDPMRDILPLFFLEDLLLAFCSGARAGCCCLCHFLPRWALLLAMSC